MAKSKPVLTEIKLRHFRCFRSLACEFAPGANVIAGPNAQGKTSLLEAVCVLLRLQSPRITMLGHAIQHEQRGFVVDGHCAARHMQFYFSRERKKIALDSVVQKTAREYLEIARVVYFSNPDIEIVRGAAEQRRKFLDFVAAQLDATYRRNLRAYERALRSRNHLLKMPRPNLREIAAFDGPLIESGTAITQARARLVEALQPHAEAAQRVISGARKNAEKNDDAKNVETLEIEHLRGADGDFADALAAAREEDLRLRQTTVGPHRDDLALFLNERSSEFASEGQQRSIALALKLAQAKLLEENSGAPPLLLLDDIFGELDPARRNALLQNLPAHAQQIITTTHLDWMERATKTAQIFRLENGSLTRQQ